MIVGGARPFFIKILFGDTARLAAHLAQAPDLHAREYPRFLAEVRARTKPGESIAILVPMRHWNDGYAYAYYRASYVLAGRRVMPLVAPDDRVLVENLSRADYAAAWNLDRPLPHHRVVWRGARGVLARSVK